MCYTVFDVLSCRKCRSIFCMIKLNPPCKRIDNYKDIPPVWKRSYEVYVKAFHRCVSRCREAMSMNRYFQHAHLLIWIFCLQFECFSSFEGHVSFSNLHDFCVNSPTVLLEFSSMCRFLIAGSGATTFPIWIISRATTG
jgi:hypothetical protein